MCYGSDLVYQQIVGYGLCLQVVHDCISTAYEINRLDGNHKQSTVIDSNSIFWDYALVHHMVHQYTCNLDE